MRRRLRTAAFAGFTALAGVPCGAGGTAAGGPVESVEAVPVAVRNACALAESVAKATPGVSVTRSTGAFPDEGLRQPVRGCHLSVTGSFSAVPEGGDAPTRLREGFAAQGFEELPAWTGDGKDGSDFALRHGTVACLFRASWNGGSDGEPEIPREDGYRVSILCTGALPTEPERR